MLKVELLIGMIGSGKSRYALSRANEGAIIICHDTISASVHGEQRYEQELRDFYRRVQTDMLCEAFIEKRDVVIDRTHLTRESRQWWKEWCDYARKMKSFDDIGEFRVAAVTFPIHGPDTHARRRFEADNRGRSYAEWLSVAMHHADQAFAEPLNAVEEGFDWLTVMMDSGERHDFDLRKPDPAREA